MRVTSESVFGIRDKMYVASLIDKRLLI